MSDDLAWETLSSTVAYRCPGFEVVREDVRLPDGTETDYDYLSERPAVVVLPFTPDGDVVVIEEWRQAVDRVNRGLPAGGTEADEAVLAAAERELREETGHAAVDLTRLATLEPANGVADSVHHYVVAHGCTPTAEQDLDADESIRVSTTDYAALREAVFAGEVRDARTALGVFYWECSDDRRGGALG